MCVCQVGRVAGTTEAVKLKAFLLIRPSVSVITSHTSLCSWWVTGLFRLSINQGKNSHNQQHTASCQQCQWCEIIIFEPWCFYNIWINMCYPTRCNVLYLCVILHCHAKHFVLFAYCVSGCSQNPAQQSWQSDFDNNLIHWLWFILHLSGHHSAHLPYIWVSLT